AILVPPIALAVVVSIVANVPGSERAVSSLLWALMLAAVGLPIARTLGVSAYGGLFMDYGSIVGPLDRAMGADGFSHPGWMMMAKHLLLPAAAVLALLLIGLLFRSGLEAGLLPQEMLSVDPVMDREVARVAAAGPRLGGRTAAALGSAVVPSPIPASVPASIPSAIPAASPEHGAGPSVVRTSAGDAPRRII
ncbi:MAG: hypothetical protein KDA22_15045, partial [Phycisphaerales bacterium]|nr:hypothetical protein [Phycisphaerales bacterium]